MTDAVNILPLQVDHVGRCRYYRTEPCWLDTAGIFWERCRRRIEDSSSEGWAWWSFGTAWREGLRSWAPRIVRSELCHSRRPKQQMGGPAHGWICSSGGSALLLPRTALALGQERLPRPTLQESLCGTAGRSALIPESQEASSTGSDENKIPDQDQGDKDDTETGNPAEEMPGRCVIGPLPSITA